LTTGSHLASKVSTAHLEILITGAVFNNNNRFFLTGYETSLTPFLIDVSYNRMPCENIFFSGFNKSSLIDEMGSGSQIEAITNIATTGKYYISRENFSTSTGGSTFTFKQKLYEFYDKTAPLLALLKNELELLSIRPNPAIDKINIKTNSPISNIKVYTSLGEKVKVRIIRNKKEIAISSVSTGIYYLKIQLENTDSNIIRKIIKL
jgi:hypothetical protein